MLIHVHISCCVGKFYFVIHSVDGSTLSYSVKRGLRLIRQLQIDSKTTQSGLSVRRTNVPSQFIVRKADLSSTTAQSKLSKVKTAQTNLSKVQMAQPMTKSTQ